VRPLTLDVQGFTAFRELQSVDFSELDLFVITGPTGAGKTSLLDAIVFSLYGQVPRLGSSRGTNNLVSLGQTRASVLLEFSLGPNRYRVARRLPRTGAQTAKFERFDGSDWKDESERSGVKEINARIQGLLGLDFEAFTKAVMLPQNEFHKFLKGDVAERRAVLTALLGVEYFKRMSQIAGERRRDLTSRTEATEGVIANQYADATAEGVTQAERASANADAHAQQLASVLAEATRHADVAAEQRTLADGLGQQQGEFASVAADLRCRVTTYQQAEIDGAVARKALESADSEVRAHQDSVASADAARTVVEATVGSHEQIAALESAQRRWSAFAADEIGAINSRNGEMAVVEGMRSTLQGATESADVAADELEAATAVLAAQQSVVEGGRPQVDSLTNARRLAAKCRDDVEAAREQAAIAAGVLPGLRRTSEEHSRALETAYTRRRESERANAVAALIAGLGAGDPCPVCQEPLGDHVHMTDDVEQRLANAESALELARMAAEQSRRALTAAEARDVSERAQVEREERRLAEALGEFADYERLDAAATEAQAAHDEATALLRQHQTEVAKAQVAERSARATLMEVTRRLTESEGNLNTAETLLERIRRDRKQTEEILEAAFGRPVPVDVADRVSLRREQLNTVTQAHEAAQNVLTAKLAVRENARRQMDVAQDELGKVVVELERRRTQAEGARKVALRANVTVDIPELPDPDKGPGAFAVSLATTCEQAGRILAEVINKARGTAGEFDRKVVELAVEAGILVSDAAAGIEGLKAAEAEARDAAVRARSAVEAIQARARQRQDLEDAIAENRKQAAVYGNLATELRADHFGEYIVQETMDMLAGTASTELRRISEDRYSLVAADAEFAVIDHANADEQRSVKTLSGGETFLASLALALALSRHVGELAAEGLGARLEAVFIDEGFGTLDPETLDDVIDALERLQADDLMVGVISHVPALAQRIGVGLEVSKGDGGSTISAKLPV
jgi:exonuclease SbcC